MRFLTLLHEQEEFNRNRDDEERDARARRAVQTNNFTQQTNALDVDKHMLVLVPNQQSSLTFAQDGVYRGESQGPREAPRRG